MDTRGPDCATRVANLVPTNLVPTLGTKFVFETSGSEIAISDPRVQRTLVPAHGFFLKHVGQRSRSLTHEFGLGGCKSDKGRPLSDLQPYRFVKGGVPLFLIFSPLPFFFDQEVHPSRGWPTRGPDCTHGCKSDKGASFVGFATVSVCNGAMAKAAMAKAKDAPTHTHATML